MSEQSKPKFELPKIYSACAHPQSVWFEEHWRPIFDALSAKCAELEELLSNKGGKFIETNLLRTENESLRAQLAEKEAELMVLKSDYGTCDAERDTLKAEIEKLHQELEVLEYSNSKTQERANHHFEQNQLLREDWVKLTEEVKYCLEMVAQGNPKPCLRLSETLADLKYKGE